MYKTKVTIWTDGACSPKTKIGGYAYIAQYLKWNEEFELYQLVKEKKDSKTIISTTNNRMELLAAIRTLQWIIKNRSIDRKDPSANKELYKIHTDSNYVKEGITKWIIGWKKKNFVGVKNPDLWQLLDKLNGHMGKCVEWHWVRGHDISEGNIEADRLANLGCTVAK